MLEIRWHSRAGQGAVTGAKGLADVIAGTGKEVQAFASAFRDLESKAICCFLACSLMAFALTKYSCFCFSSLTLLWLLRLMLSRLCNSSCVKG